METPNITYNGASTPPSSSGIYQVVASFAGDSNYAPASAASGIVINAIPLLSCRFTGPTDPLALSVNALVSVAFDDAATNDAHTCRFDWEDENPDTVVNLASGASACQAAHSYSAAGVYVVDVQVTDDDGYGVVTSFRYV